MANPIRQRGLEEALAASHDDPVTAVTAAALRKAVRKSQDPAAAAKALRVLPTLDIGGDPFFGRGPGLDCAFLASLAAELPSLRELVLSRNDLRDPGALAAFAGLSSLSAVDCKIVDTAFVSAFTELECLRMGENPIANPDAAVAALPLGKLRILGIASLGGEGASRLRDIGPLASSPLLEELDVSKNALSTLAPLRATLGLRTLQAAGNLVDDLTPLSKLRKLRALDVSENRVNDLTPIQDLYALVELDFRGNGVRSLKPLKGLRDLQRVRCGGNPLYDDDYDVIRRSVLVD